MDIFRGWYRKSLSRKNTVWHRVCHVNSILSDRQMAITLCGKHIPTTKCDFDMEATVWNERCIQCNRFSDIVVETGRGFVPTDITSITTKKSAVKELIRLSKPRTYFVKIFGHQGVAIKAIWESDTSIELYIDDANISGNIKRRLFTLQQVQADLNHFKSEIDCLCDASDALAKEEKLKKGLKGRLTPSEQNAYFEELLWEMGTK